MRRIPWQSWVVFASGVGLFFFQTGLYWSATWLSKWMFLIALGALALAVYVARRTSWLYFPLLIYALGSMIAISIYPQTPYQDMLDPVVILALQKNALYGLIQFAGLALLFSWVDRRASVGIGAFLSMVWVAGVAGFLLLPSSGPHSPPNNGMWFGNPSMGASLLACLLPAVVGFRHWGRSRRTDVFSTVWSVLAVLLTFLAVLVTKASVPWGVFGAVIAAFIVARMPRALFVGALSVLVIAASLIAFGQSYLGADFWAQNGRFEIWQMAWDYFWVHAHPSVGFGFSSSQILVPVEQILTGHVHGDYFLWLHNDWLQLAIEGGYIGMFCVFLALFRLIRVTWVYPGLFASFTGFIVLGLFNYPLRMPIHCFCLVLICGLAESGASFARRSPS